MCLYEALLDGARRRIYLTTPYFGPGRALRDALGRAARRGVDVRRLVPERADPVLTGWVTRSCYEALLASGLRIYELEHRRLHAKPLAVDGEWARRSPPERVFEAVGRTRRPAV